MELILDTANVEAIKYYQQVLTIDGVTTNPTILTKENRDYREVIQEIIDVLHEDQSLHIQVVSTDVEGIVKEGKVINQLRKNTYAKIPCTKEGFQAMKQLKQEGYLVTATACYSANQGVLAAKCGVDYIAPYLNRLDNIGVDGVAIIADLVAILDYYGYPTKVVAASFKNAQQALEMMKAGCPAMTIAPEVIDKMMEQSMTDDAVRAFSNDWKKAFIEEGFNW